MEICSLKPGDAYPSWDTPLPRHLFSRKLGLRSDLVVLAHEFNPPLPPSPEPKFPSVLELARGPWFRVKNRNIVPLPNLVPLLCALAIFSFRERLHCLMSSTRVVSHVDQRSHRAIESDKLQTLGMPEDIYVTPGIGSQGEELSCGQRPDKCCISITSHP